MLAHGKYNHTRYHRLYQVIFGLKVFAWALIALFVLTRSIIGFIGVVVIAAIALMLLDAFYYEGILYIIQGQPGPSRIRTQWMAYRRQEATRLRDGKPGKKTLKWTYIVLGAIFFLAAGMRHHEGYERTNTLGHMQRNMVVSQESRNFPGQTVAITQTYPDMPGVPALPTRSMMNNNRMDMRNDRREMGVNPVLFALGLALIGYGIRGVGKNRNDDDLI